MRRALIKMASLLIVLLMPVSGGGLVTEAGAVEATPSAEQEPRVAFALHMADSEQSVVFRVTAEPSTQENVTAVFGNFGKEPTTALIYAANGETSVNGGLTIAGADSAPSGPTTWLDFEAETLDLAPGETIERPITVSVPADTAPGEYVAALAIQTAEPQEIEGTEVFNQIIRRASAFYITVPGDSQPAFEIGEIRFVETGESIRFAAAIANTGNTRVYPTGTVSFSNPDGELVATAPIEMGAVYAFQETTLEIGFQSPLPPGEYVVDIELSDPETGAGASLTGHAVTAPDPLATPEPPPPVAIQDVSIEPGPDADTVQFAVVDATITNTGEPIGNAQLSLLVNKNGEEVERFPISQALSLQTGDTGINTRYIPLGGWSSGEWTFELLLEQVEGSGAAVVVASQQIEGSITIP